MKVNTGPVQIGDDLGIFIRKDQALYWAAALEGLVKNPTLAQDWVLTEMVRTLSMCLAVGIVAKAAWIPSREWIEDVLTALRDIEFAAESWDDDCPLCDQGLILSDDKHTSYCIVPKVRELLKRAKEWQ